MAFQEQDGFIRWDELRKVARAVGPAAVIKSLGHVPLLLVRRERAVEGKTYLLGRCAPLRLPAGASAMTLGRGAGVELRVDLPTVSSRHLSFSGKGGWSITDASSNGTWVAGKKLDRGAACALADRQLVCLADHVWLEFLLPDTAAGLLAQDASPREFEVVDERAGHDVRTPHLLAISSFMGRIQGTELVDFLQMLDLNKRTGMLVVSWGPSHQRKGKLALRSGLVVDATAELLTGRPAVMELLSVRSGMFAFTGCDVEGGSLSLAIAPLLMEAARLEDERKR